MRPSPDELRDLLRRARTIAVVGLSPKPIRPSHSVTRYLQEAGYRIIPINPGHERILGEQSYPTLEAAGRDHAIDIVNVFRAPDAVPGIAKDAVAIGAKCLWCQFGVINEEGARIAEQGGLSVVMDRCIKVEHARFVGRMHWLGFNTQRITSVRGGLQ